MHDTLRAKLRAFRSDLPLEQAHTIPALWYFDEEIYRAECRHVFGGTWQIAGLLDHVATAGSYLTTDIAGEPVLVLRDDAGELRAFYNVCRHRAALVMTEPRGHATRLRCRYHGWTYDLQGRLRGTPEFDGVADFCREEQGLPPLRVDTWGPYVWVCGDEKAPSLSQFLTPLPEHAAAQGIESLRWVERREYPIACNWKVFVDNFQDGGYHVNTVHPTLASALDYSRYRTEITDNTTVQISPLQPAEDESLSRLRSGDAAYYWWIFPNVMVNLYSGVMDVNIVLPDGPERCRVIFDWFFPPAADAQAEQTIRDSIDVSHQVQLEDIGISEDVQRGLRSRTYNTGRFSVRREEPVYHFHRLLAARLGAGVDAG